MLLQKQVRALWQGCVAPRMRRQLLSLNPRVVGQSSQTHAVRWAYKRPFISHQLNWAGWPGAVDVSRFGPFTPLSRSVFPCSFQ